MDAKNLKCVIFDFDSTLYVNGNWDNEDDYWQGYLDYAKIKGVTVSEICEKYSSPHKMKSLCRYTREIGFDDAVFFEYSDKFLYDMTNENLRVVDNNLLEELKKYYKIFLISDSTPGYLRHYMKEFKININVFTECISNKYDANDMSKYPSMISVLNKTGLKPNEILMVGDSLLFDIEPAKKAGFETKKVDCLEDTESIIKDLIEIAKQR